MKKIILILLAVLLISIMPAQDYQIDFDGVGAASSVDSVQVINSTQGSSLSLAGSDILHLTGTVAIEQFKTAGNDLLTIFPNPMNTQCFVKFYVPENRRATLTIYDISGKKVSSMENEFLKGYHTVQASGLRKGVYTLKILSDTYSYSGKIVSNNSDEATATIACTAYEEDSKLKSSREIIPMQYNAGDLLHFFGYAEEYFTVSSAIPTSSATVTFNFVEATDSDGNNYGTVTLGEQVWMLENLKTTSFNDAEPITEYTSDDDWYYDLDPVTYYQWANTEDLNDLYEEELPFDFFGAMYNETSLASGKLAPDGWRIPTEQDFIELINFLTSNGHEGAEAVALKSIYGWVESSGNGIDLFGFNGLPNGYVSGFGQPTGAQVICSWATSDNPTDQTRRIANLFDENTILFFDNSIQLGAGVRCIKE